MFCEALYGHECIFRLVKECGWDGGDGVWQQIWAQARQVIWLRWALKVLD